MLKPSHIMAWDFTRKIVTEKMHRNDYAAWKRAEKEAQEWSKELKR